MSIKEHNNTGLVYDMMDHNIILFGLPRSGTTWLSEVLTQSDDVDLFHEPDNELISFPALVLKTGLARFPYLKAEDQNKNYQALYSSALSSEFYDYKSVQNHLPYKIYGKSKNDIQNSLTRLGTANSKKLPLSGLFLNFLNRGQRKKRVLIKTVHGFLSIAFLMSHFNFIPLVMTRHPLNIFSSYKSLDMSDQDRQIYLDANFLEDHKILALEQPSNYSSDFKAGFQLGAFNKHLHQVADNNEKIIMLNYETIIENPFEEIESICHKLHIQFSKSKKEFIESRFKKGNGYETLRVPSEQFRVWEKRLHKEQIDEFLKGYERSAGQIDFMI